MKTEICAHDGCKLCRPALQAIQRLKKNRRPSAHVVIELRPDHNAFGAFMGFHFALARKGGA